MICGKLSTVFDFLFKPLSTAVTNLILNVIPTYIVLWLVRTLTLVSMVNRHRCTFLLLLCLATPALQQSNATNGAAVKPPSLTCKQAIAAVQFAAKAMAAARSVTVPVPNDNSTTPSKEVIDTLRATIPAATQAAVNCSTNVLPVFPTGPFASWGNRLIQVCLLRQPP